MKTYIKPSLEVKKFDVEDIIQTSSGGGTVVNYEALSQEGQELYKAYDAQAATTGNYLEFWL